MCEWYNLRLDKAQSISNMSDVLLRSELQISNIETNKQFCRLAEKTQVVFPGKHSEVIRNRQTHSYEVATSASIMALSIAQKKNWASLSVDYQGSIKPCSLCHDLGLGALGHDGATILDAYFKSKGLDEGFCDNNNTIVVIEKNNIMVSRYTICSVIKYPEKMYASQKLKYADLLALSIKEDKDHFLTLGLDLIDQKRTIACQVMDEADRNSYVTSDLSDFFCLGNTLSVDVIKAAANKIDLAYRYTELSTLLSVLRSADKSSIKSYFNNLKNQFNMNYTMTEEGVTVINKDLHAYREFLWDIEFEYYIKPIRNRIFHEQNVGKFRNYIDRVVDGGFTPSRTYALAIEQAQSPEEKLRAQRDMIGEVTDFYVTEIHLRAQLADGVPNQSIVGVFGSNYPNSMVSDI